MWIKALRTEDFGALGTGEFRFSPGLNVIYGPNEAGKTTLFEALEGALLGKVALSRDYRGRAEVLLVMGEREVWVGDKGKRPEALRMAKQVFENLYFVRTGEVSFKDQQGFLKDLKARLLDVERLYRAKEAIKAKLGRDLRVLGERFQKKGEIEQELERLKGQLEDLRAKERLLEERARDLRRLRALREEEERVRALLKELEGREQILRKVLEKRSLRGRLEALLQEKRDAEQLRGLRERLKALLPFEGSVLKELEALRAEALASRERLRVLEGNLEELRRTIGEKEALEGQKGKELGELRLEGERLLLRIKALEGVEPLAQRLVELRARARELGEKLKGKKGDLEEGQRRLDTLRAELLRLNKASKSLGILWASGMLALAGLMALGWVKGLWPLVLGASVGLLLLLPLGVRARRRVKGARELSEAIGAEEKALGELREEVQGLQEALRALGEEEARELKATGCRDEQDLHRRLEELNSLRGELRALEGRMAQLQREREALRGELEALRAKERERAGEIAKERDVLRRAEQAVEGRLRALGLGNLRDLEALVKEREALEEKISLLEQKGLRDPGEIEGEIDHLLVRLRELEDIPLEVEREGELQAALEGARERYNALAREISEIEGRLAEKERILGMGEGEFFQRLKGLEDRVSQLEARRRAYLTLYEALEEVERRLDRELMEIIRGRTKEWFSLVVGERVEEILLLDNDLRVVLDGRRLSPRELSSGTRDPLYLCARVAIAEKAKGLRVLLLDDPFITCDPQRTLRCLDILQRLSEGFQILLATKDPWLRDEALKRKASLIQLGSMGT